MRLTPLVLACRFLDYERPGQRQAKGGEPYTQSYLAEPGLTYGLKYIFMWDASGKTRLGK